VAATLWRDGKWVAPAAPAPRAAAPKDAAPKEKGDGAGDAKPAGTELKDGVAR
jgi:hypothetical protein